jgi:hypothetical protein
VRKIGGKNSGEKMRKYREKRKKYERNEKRTGQ